MLQKLICHCDITDLPTGKLYIQRIAQPIHYCMNFCVSAPRVIPICSANRESGLFFCTRAVLVRFTAGTVNTHILHVGIFGKNFEYGFKHPCLFPFGKTFVYGVPVSVNRRQISPRRTCPQDPEDTIDHITYIIERTPFTSNRQIWIIRSHCSSVRSPLRVTGKSCLCMVYPPLL